MKTTTQADIDKVRAYRTWDVGNRVLYDMCAAHPDHRAADEIIAKVWLIGRSYAASIERRRNAKDDDGEFYENIVAPTMLGSPIDTWLSSIEQSKDPGTSQTIVVHKLLMDLFCSITDLEKRSLASKYLHFHKPDAFFIYDSRARQAITRLVPRLSAIEDVETVPADREYKDFVRRCLWLRKNILETLGVALTPRELDTLLLTTSA